MAFSRDTPEIGKGILCMAHVGSNTLDPTCAIWDIEILWALKGTVYIFFLGIAAHQNTEVKHLVNSRIFF